MDQMDGLIAQLFLQPPPKVPSGEESDGHIYPELLLHQTPKANRYYGSLQQYTRQFISEENQNSVVRFSHSNLEKLLREKVNRWDDTDVVPESLRDNHLHSVTGSTNAANSLFSWSSGDKYIAARKLELQRKNDSPEKPQISVVRPTASISQKLNRVVEKESNRFIQDRIEIIKAHHTKQASKKVDERKRRDHEMHLHRLKLKEEEYEKALRAAIASQSMSRQSGFFGSLFGFSQKANMSFTMDLWDSAEVPRTTSSRNSHESSSTKSKMPLFPAKLFGSSGSSRPGSPRFSENGVLENEVSENRVSENEDTPPVSVSNTPGPTVDGSVENSPNGDSSFLGLDDILSLPNSPVPFLPLEQVAPHKPTNDDLLML